MGSDEENGKGFTASWSLSGKPCDTCKSAGAVLFCRADSAFLCVGCDGRIHSANKLASRHERVWLCDVCEQAPATVTCKADAAALCVTCDRDIHSANPLARRHERFPVVPFNESAATAVKSFAANLLVPDGLIKRSEEDDDQNDVELEDDTVTCREEVEAASWLLPNPNHKLMETPDLKSGEYFFSEVDPYLDLDYASSMDARFQHQNGAGADSVVPVQTKVPPPPMMHPSSENCFEIDFCRSKPSYSYTTPSLSHSVSSSSLDVGVVPDNSNAMTDISNPYETLTSSAGATENQASQLSGLDREARVLRYREKRKNRKFEKTIRYASRKAYAETRPRIKGRFAKRAEIDSEVDRLFPSAAALMADTGYAVEAGPA